MACDKPSGDCTSVSPCASSGCSDCGCAEDCGSGGVPLPKCQDVSLTPGAYTNATVVINADGCISQVTAGEAPVYTPDDCCGDSGTGGTGTTGPRGPKGDPGQAATVTVDPVIATGTGSTWSVQNTGTTSAAIFKFTAPASSSGGSGSVSGTTGNVCGLDVQNGVVKAMPSSLVTEITPEATGTRASLISFTISPFSTSNPCNQKLSLNLDSFYASVQSLVNSSTTTVSNDVTALETRVDDLETRLDSCCGATTTQGVGVNDLYVWNDTDAAVTYDITYADGSTATIAVAAKSTSSLPRISTSSGNNAAAVRVGGKVIGVFNGYDGGSGGGTGA